jgi:hypothetical protein
MLVSLMSKNSLDLGVGLCITQFYGDGVVGTTWPHLHPHGDLSPTKRIDPAAKKSSVGSLRQSVLLVAI